MITGLNWTIRRPRNATRVRKDANYKYTLPNLWAGRPSLVFFRLVKAQKLLLRWLALQYQALFVVPVSRVRYLWQLFGAFTISSLKVRLHLNLSEWQLFSPFQSKKNYFTSNFMQNLTIHFGNIKSWYNYSTTMFAKYTSTNQMVLCQLKLELFEKKFTRVSSIFQNVPFFLSGYG